MFLVFAVFSYTEDHDDAMTDLNLISYETSTFPKDAFITALTEGADGTTFSFGAGTYNFSNTIPLADIAGLTIKGAGKTATIFDFSNSTSTSGEGIAAIDAGIYSGQNNRVILRNNTMTLNVFGMEVENNVGAEVYGNTFIENTAGLLIYDLAGVERIKSGRNCKVYDNTFTNNNQTNFAELGSTFAADVPPGIGILFASTSSVEITDNTFIDNESASILGVAYFLVDPRANSDYLYVFK